MTTRPIEIVGHGGAGHTVVNNSPAAFERALAVGVDRIECDVRLSRDRRLVLVHDARLPAPDGTWRPVAALTLAELRGLVPDLLLLDDLIELIADRVPLMLDVKLPGYEAEIGGAIRRHGLVASSSVSTTHAVTLLRLRHAFPTLRLGLSTGHWAGGARSATGRAGARAALRATLPLLLPPVLLATRATDLMLHHHVATRPLLAAVHALGRRVNLWTVDDPAAIRRALALRPNAIISNRPDLVRKIAIVP